MTYKGGRALRVLCPLVLTVLALLVGVGAATLLLAGAHSQAQAVRSSAIQSVFPAVSFIKDINSGTNSSNPEWLAAVGNSAFFQADDVTYGQEVWKSDGTQAGTVRVTDIAANQLHSYPRDLTDVNGTLFFRATDGYYIQWDNLYKSDGTMTGTHIVTDITPGTDRSFLGQLTDVDGVLFFTTGDDTISRDKLWKSDGTPAGTVKLADVPMTDFEDMVNVNGVLYFSVADSELWKSDGTVTGTVLVKDVYTGTGVDPYLGELAHVSGTLYFAASDGVHGTELWKSDGTVTGTQMVKDINTLHTYGSSGYGIGTGSLACGSWARLMVGVDDMLFFAANDGIHGTELWKSDGTVTGTQMVEDINALSSCDPDGWDVGTGSSGCSSFPTYLTAFDHRLVFGASESVSDAPNGLEPWVSDGTVTGTYMLRDIVPGDDGPYPKEFTEVNGRLLFSAYDATNGRELWSLAFYEHGVFLPLVLENQ